MNKTSAKNHDKYKYTQHIVEITREQKHETQGQVTRLKQKL